MFMLWLFVSIMSIYHSCLGVNSPLHAYSPGDIIIGGLFPIHSKTNRTTLPGAIACNNYEFDVFLHTQVMIHAIREVNQRTPRVLPNFTIGYDIYDTCGDVSIAIRAALQLLKNQSDPQSCLVPENIQSALSEPQTKVVIGERYSEVSIAVARILALSSVAQISHASTSEVLSKKYKFPSFLRTVPSDAYQTKGIVELVKEFNWKTVVIVGSDDEYGKYGSDRLEDHFMNEDICIEFILILPGNFNQNSSLLPKLVEKINDSSAEAIILFTKDTYARIIMKEAIESKLNRTWIASDTWSTSSKISSMPHFERAGQVFGFIFKRKEVPGFKDYVTSVFNGTTNSFIKHHLTRYPLCLNQSEENEEQNCLLTNNQQCLHPSCLATHIDQDESYSIYLAVQVIVEGLRRLLKCSNQQCERGPKFTAVELLMEIQKVNFTVNTTHIFFNDKGDPSLGYDIVHWNMSKSTQGSQIGTIGEYWPNGTIRIPEYLLSSMKNVTVTAYNCSKTCEPGQEMKVQRKKCCYDCVKCTTGEFSPGNGTECKRCGVKQYSLEGQRDACFNKADEYLFWSDHFSIILNSFGILGIIVTIGFTVLFAIYSSTPIVKAVGGYLCFLELLSLLASFCLTFVFMGKPTKASCFICMPFFFIVFSICISCILANLLQILVGFNFHLKLGSWIKKCNRPVAVVTIVSGVQLVLSVSWLTINPPTPTELPSNTTILHQCEIKTRGFILAMIAYQALLGFICFLFAFKGKQLPDLYKNAVLISVSMLLILIIWAVFTPLYLTLTGKYKPAIESATILISSYSILGCHLAPKCYIMVFRKELNNENAITEYIRKYYEQKGVAVVRS
ncbi:G-protein coupled receptor family C group 6 member A-like [Amphiprion ocellaris]|uniref:G-protein coupled receptor family C group 6 member A-like n=1 Tax=Amphiprion ocellaris TaxID=80972 RepID=UPI000C30DD2B|nr:G-protein coupled receptor family C group 6 member A-like [Amphiprion ocellaris]